MELGVRDSPKRAEEAMRMQAVKQKNNTATRYVLAALVLFLYYYIYRYVLQYNDDETSPTYSDTPFLFQAAKYLLLLLLLCAFFVHVLLRHRRGVKIDVLFVAASLLILQNVYIFLVSGDADAVTMCCCLFLALLIHFTAEETSLDAVDRLFAFFLHFAILYECVQIALYFIAGRLPALGYDTGNLTDVRFGGPWDAPNEFALLLAFLLPYAALRYQGWRRVLYVAVLIVMLILSWSLTGIATILLIAVVVGLKELFLRSRNALHTLTACVAGLCVLGAFGLVLYFNSDAIHAFVASKMGSIQGHLDGWDLSGLTLWNFLGLYPDMEFSEVGLIVLLRRGGVVQVLLFYGLGIYCAVRAGRLAKVHRGDAVRRRLYTGMQWYLIAFLIASFNLPMMVSFSNLGVFCVFVALTARAPCPAPAVPERAGEGNANKAPV